MRGLGGAGAEEESVCDVGESKREAAWIENKRDSATGFCKLDWRLEADLQMGDRLLAGLIQRHSLSSSPKAGARARTGAETGRGGYAASGLGITAQQQWVGPLPGIRSDRVCSVAYLLTARRYMPSAASPSCRALMRLIAGVRCPPTHAGA